MSYKRIVALLLVSAALAIAPLFITVNNRQNWPTTQTGWPWAHSKAVHTGGLCVGIDGATNDDCAEHYFPRNNAYVLYDYILWFIVIASAGFLGLYIRDKKI